MRFKVTHREWGCPEFPYLIGIKVIDFRTDTPDFITISIEQCYRHRHQVDPFRSDIFYRANYHPRPGWICFHM